MIVVIHLLICLSFWFSHFIRDFPLWFFSAFCDFLNCVSQTITKCWYHKGKGDLSDIWCLKVKKKNICLYLFGKFNFHTKRTWALAWRNISRDCISDRSSIFFSSENIIHINWYTVDLFLFVWYQFSLIIHYIYYIYKVCNILL